jgi:hypothetical protein
MQDISLEIKADAGLHLTAEAYCNNILGRKIMEYFPGGESDGIPPILRILFSLGWMGILCGVLGNPAG